MNNITVTNIILQILSSKPRPEEMNQIYLCEPSLEKEIKPNQIQKLSFRFWKDDAAKRTDDKSSLGPNAGKFVYSILLVNQV